jgi:hypothetical protein
MSETDWRERAETAEARVTELAAERARLWEEVNRLRAHQREAEYHMELAKKIEGSLSWQITEPLRIVKELAVKVQRRLAERRERER